MHPFPRGGPRLETSTPAYKGDENHHHHDGVDLLRSVAPAPLSPKKNKNNTRGISRSKSCNDGSLQHSPSSPSKSSQNRRFLFGAKKPAEQQQQHQRISSSETPPSSSSPRRTKASSNMTAESLPCPKSPLRVTFRRKATKGPAKKKSRVVEEILEEYDDDGVLERTTITRTKNPDGSTSTEKHKERINPTSSKYPKSKSIKERRQADSTRQQVA